MPRRSISRLQQFLATAALFLLGMLFLRTRLGDGLGRLSYDLPFMFRHRLAAPRVALVYLDEASAQELQQAPDLPVKRRLYTRLVERLTRDGARAILFDIVFQQPSEDPSVDLEFAAALRQHGQVVLSAGLEVAEEEEQGVQMQHVIAPTPVLREAAAGWGLASFQLDADHGVRRLFPGASDIPSATAELARLLRAPETPRETRWLNYYGPPDWLPGVSLAQALREDGVSPHFFREKLVFIGGRPNTSALTMAKDEFAGPWSRWQGRFFPGLEIHATSLLNQMEHSWLTQLAPEGEAALLLATAVGCGLLLTLRPPLPLLVGMAAMAALLVAGVLSVWWSRVWWPWLIPAVVQIPLGVGWSWSAQYFVVARRRAALRRAFSLYLSPHMAEKIAESDFDLTLGGQHVQATVMFTDLAGFSALAEELDDPAQVVAVLNQYFTRTTACILENDGTIIKYMGDAVEAVWNAPVADPDHARKAARAACRLRDVSSFVALGRTIRTRIGINTGPAFAGNLGSEFRFDYAVIGDTTNFAARLEGLNKYFGTELLISEGTRAVLGEEFVTRSLGRVRVAGKALPLEIHELLAPVAEWDVQERWPATFARGLQAFQSAQWAEARAYFTEAQAQRTGGDPPAEVFLQRLRLLEREPPGVWEGVLEFTTK